MDLIGFDQLLEETDLVVTGEGRMDWQSAFGKVPGGVCQESEKPEEFRWQPWWAEWALDANGWQNLESEVSCRRFQGRWSLKKP